VGRVDGIHQRICKLNVIDLDGVLAGTVWKESTPQIPELRLLFCFVCFAISEPSPVKDMIAQ